MPEDIFEIEVTGTHRGESVHQVFQSTSWNVWRTRVRFSPLFDDLHGIAWIVHFLDRLFLRDKKTWTRHFRCSISVIEPDFWNASRNYELLTNILHFISGDHWEFEFTQSAKKGSVQKIFDLEFDNEVHCLYSGGLDSMAGLVGQLQKHPDKFFIPTTVYHRTDIKKSTYHQLAGIAKLYPNLLPKQRCVFPFRMEKTYDLFGKKREPTQRTRPFLFMVAGGITALQRGGKQLEVYEAGIGAINAPLLPRMSGSMTTRSSHPEFLKMMGELLSLISQKEFKIVLPFADVTKGELVSVLHSKRSLQSLARSSFSCVCYPRRNAKKKVCGKCLACIFRRIALHQAGIKDNLEDYEYDLLNKDHWDQMNSEDRRPLCIFLEQIDELGISTQDGRLPEWIEDHIISTNATMGRSMASVVDLYRRYSIACSHFIEKAIKKKCQWAV